MSAISPIIYYIIFVTDTSLPYNAELTVSTYVRCYCRSAVANRYIFTTFFLPYFFYGWFYLFMLFSYSNFFRDIA